MSPWAAFLSYLVPGLGQVYQGRIGKVLAFTTSAEPKLARPTTFPRVYATPSLLTQLKDRNGSGDAAFVQFGVAPG